MNILFVAPYYKPAHIYGGPSRSVPALAEALAALGHEIAVFTTNANGPVDLDVPTDRPVEVDGVPVHYFRRVPKAPGRYLYAPDLGRACRSRVGDHDAVYVSATWTYPFIPACRYARQADVPYVISPRGSFMDWSMGQKRSKKQVYLSLVERRYIDAAAAIHCTTPMEMEQIRQWKFKAPPVLIPNGVDLHSFQDLPVRGALRAALNIPQTAPVSLFVGRLHQMKRIDRIVEAFAQVAGSAPDSHLILVGPEEDGSGERARQWAAHHGLAERVHFTGSLAGDELLRAYADADLLVLLSHRENFGMVVVEAMAAGLPVLLSSQVGVAEEVERAGAGIVVDADSGEAEAAWKSLLTAPDKRAAMGKAGRDLAISQFSAQAAARQMAELLQRIAPPACGQDATDPATQNR